MIPRNIQGRRIIFLSDLPFHSGQLQHFTKEQFEYTRLHRELCPTISQQMDIQWAFMEDWRKEVNLQLHHLERSGEIDRYRFRLS